MGQSPKLRQLLSKIDNEHKEIQFLGLGEKYMAEKQKSQLTFPSLLCLAPKEMCV